MLRERGVTPGARKRDVDSIGLREAERLTGVSRQTISDWLQPMADDERRNYTAKTLDAVAHGLGINRRELGIAAARDAGALLVNTDAGLLDIYEYLETRNDDENAELLGWLAQRLASRGRRGQDH
jgi:transcriptional regulator with XRE-family HTH domain